MESVVCALRGELDLLLALFAFDIVGTEKIS